MAKWQVDAMLDAALSYISSNATKIYVCGGQPADYAGLTSTGLASGVPSFQSPDDGDASGRKLAVDEEADITVHASSGAGHIALTSADTLLYVTTCTEQDLTEGNTVTVPTWDIEIADAT